MTLLTTINFQELETGEDCVVIVRGSSGRIALTITRRPDGDVEVIITAVQTRELIKALSDALDTEQNS